MSLKTIKQINGGRVDLLSLFLSSTHLLESLLTCYFLIHFKLFKLKIGDKKIQKHIFPI